MALRDTRENVSLHDAHYLPHKKEFEASWYKARKMVLMAALVRLLILPIYAPAVSDFKINESGQIAAHLLRGEGYSTPYREIGMPTAQQAPLYPLVLAVIFAVAGVETKVSLYAIMALNGLAGIVVTFLIYRAGCKFFNSSVGMIAGWAWALIPEIAITDLVPSCYALTTLAVMLWVNYVPDLTPHVRTWVLLGCGLGVMMLLNPMLVLLVPASFFWLYRRQIAVMAAAALVVVAPWHVRNYQVMGRFYPGLRSNFGLELFYGNHAGSAIGNWEQESPRTSAEYVHNGEARYFEARKKEAVDFIRAHPRSFVRRCLMRFIVFWSHPPTLDWTALFILLFPLSLWGIITAPYAMRAFTAIWILLYPLTYYITQVGWPTSYRHPVEPFMLLMAATAALAVARKRRVFGEKSRIH